MFYLAMARMQVVGAKTRTMFCCNGGMLGSSTGTVSGGGDAVTFVDFASASFRAPAVSPRVASSRLQSRRLGVDDGAPPLTKPHVHGHPAIQASDRLGKLMFKYRTKRAKTSVHRTSTVSECK